MTPAVGFSPPDRPELTVRLDFPATTEAVRGALIGLRQALAPLSLASADLDTIELVLAEVLNNVVEHAYAGTAGGQVMLTAWPVAQGLAVRIEDEGRPMPDATLPSGRGPILGNTVNDLPEGGFGWFMIHTLTRDLAYRRIGSRNCLTLRLPLGATPPA